MDLLGGLGHAFSGLGAGNSPTILPPNFGILAFKPTYILMTTAFLSYDYITNYPKS